MHLRLEYTILGLTKDSAPEQLFELANDEWPGSYLLVARLGHALITIQGYEKGLSGKERYDAHQKFSRQMAEARGKGVVLGLFPYGAAEEVSIFEDVDYWDIQNPSWLFETPPFGRDRDYRPKNFVIGWGPADLQLQIKANFDITICHDWGWVDEDRGDEHIEYYNAPTREYVRQSQTGRTCYIFSINDEGNAQIVDELRRDVDVVLFWNYDNDSKKSINPDWVSGEINFVDENKKDLVYERDWDGWSVSGIPIKVDDQGQKILKKDSDGNLVRSWSKFSFASKEALALLGFPLDVWYPPVGVRIPEGRIAITPSDISSHHGRTLVVV